MDAASPGLQRAQDLLRGKAVKSQVGIAGVTPVAGRPVDVHRIAAALQPLYKRIPLSGHPHCALPAPPFVCKISAAAAIPTHKGTGTVTGAQVVLLSSAIDDRLDTTL